MRWRDRNRIKAHADDVAWRLSEALTLQASGDTETAGALLLQLCCGPQETLTVACALGQVIVEAHRRFFPAPTGTPMGAVVLRHPDCADGDHVAAAELAAAIIAGVGNDDMPGVHLAWRHETQTVCMGATVNLFLAAGSLTQPAPRPDGGGS